MRTLLSGTFAAMVLAGPVHAADPPGAMPHPPAAAWSWTGCYVGGHAGGLWADSDKWIVETPGGAFYGRSLGGHDLGSVLGGAQVGCDYQFVGGLVVGIQGDYAFADAKGSHASALEFGVSYHSRIKSLDSVTGRIGYAWERWLGYARGGFAWERDDYSASTIVTGIAYKAEDTRTGWTAGVGAEYAVTDLISGFVEANYYDFGTSRIAFTPQIAGLPTGYLDIEATTTVVRAGLNIRFGW